MNQYMDVSEQGELVERARRDREAFGELYDQFYSQIFSYVLKRVANIETAQDITSDIFFKALKNLGQYRSRDNVPFSSWLYRIATNQVNDHLRSKKRKHRVISLEEASETDHILSTSGSSVEAEVPKAEKELRRQEEFLILHESISKLPIKYQEVITLRYFENKQRREIAQILGKPEGAVKSSLHRGLEKLREMMGQNATI
jgi:RNA polymerase sigma-70 factor (ECF subfamily)